MESAEKLRVRVEKFKLLFQYIFKFEFLRSRSVDSLPLFLLRVRFPIFPSMHRALPRTEQLFLMTPMPRRKPLLDLLARLLTIFLLSDPSLLLPMNKQSLLLAPLLMHRAQSKSTLGDQRTVLGVVERRAAKNPLNSTRRPWRHFIGNMKASPASFSRFYRISFFFIFVHD